MLFLPIRVTTTGGAAVTGLVKANVVLKKYDDPSTVYDYTSLYEVGYGQYVLIGCRNGLTLAYCKCYINGVEQDWLNILLLGDEFLTFILRAGDTGILGLLAYSTDLTITGDKTLPHKKYVDTALALKQDKVSGVSDAEIGYLDGVTSAIQTQLNAKQAIVSGVSDTEIGYLDGVTSAIQTQLNSKVGITNSETITGKKTFSGGLDAQINTSESGDSNRPKATYTDGYKAPENDAEFIEKKYADDLVAEITAEPFQESAQKVRVIVNGTVIANQVYNNIAAAINSFSALAITKQCLVSIEDTGIASQYITLNHSALKSYAHIKGVAKHINLILGVTTASVTKTVIFSDLTIWMGANAGDITTDRTYNLVTFENCDIYAYKSITGVNVIMKNCRIFQPTGETCTFTGTSQIDGCMFTNAIDCSGITGNGYVSPNTSSENSMAYTMPTDPSSSGS